MNNKEYFPDSNLEKNNISILSVSKQQLYLVHLAVIMSVADALVEPDCQLAICRLSK